MSEGTAALDAGPVGDAVDAAVAVHRDEPGALLEPAIAVQAELGWLPPTTTRLVAERLNLSRAEVHGVITFYKDLRTEPPPASTVRICLAEACQSRAPASDRRPAPSNGSGCASATPPSTAPSSSSRSSASATARWAPPSRSTASCTAGSTTPGWPRS